jgi:hypothetical protein
MGEPLAVNRARVLRKHVKWLGAPVEEFCVAVTKDEGFELLKWFRDEANPESFNYEQYDQDCAYAMRKGDPFDVLANFTLCGLAIVPLGKVN